MPLQYSGSYDLVYGHAKKAKAKNWQKNLAMQQVVQNPHRKGMRSIAVGLNQKSRYNSGHLFQLTKKIYKW